MIVPVEENLYSMSYRNVCLPGFAVLAFVASAVAKQHSDTPSSAHSQTSTPAATAGGNRLGGMRWRQLGPFRGGRVLAVTGVPGEPSVFYFGAAAGGVWRSSDAGANWEPLFDKEDIASIGSVAV